MTTVLIQLFIFLGCINDVANIKDFLTTLYGFKEVNVHVQAMGGGEKDVFVSDSICRRIWSF